MFAHHGFPGPLGAAAHGGPAARPTDTATAAQYLHAGHQRFHEWMARIHQAAPAPDAAPDLPQAELIRSLFPLDRVPTQEPFAIAIGCADARVPLRMLFGSTVNDLFEIRVAGQVLADECLGSVDYALHHLPSIQTIVVLGHTDCGAVKATVENFLKPCCLEPSEFSVGLEAIMNHILGSVVQADRSLQIAAPELPRESTTYRSRLLQTAIVVNAATIAHRLQHLIRQSPRTGLQVLFGLYDLQSHAIVSPRAAENPGWQWGLGHAPQTMEDVASSSLLAAQASVVPPGQVLSDIRSSSSQP